MIDYCRLNTKIANYDFIKNKEDNNFASRLSIDRYVHIHLDEKWYNNLYIKSYTNINLKYDDFITLNNSISNQSNILITTGVV